MGRQAVFRLGLRTRLFAVAILAVLPIAWWGVHAVNEDYVAARAAVFGGLQESALHASAEVDSVLFGAREALAAAAEEPRLMESDPGALGEYLRRVVGASPPIRALVVARTDGRIVAGALPMVGSPNLSRFAFWRDFTDTGAVLVSAQAADSPLGRSALLLVYPVGRDTGALRGVLLAELDPEAFGSLRSLAGLPAGADVLLLDGAGGVLLHYPEQAGDVGEPQHGSRLLEAMASGSTGSGWFTGPGGDEWLYAYTPAAPEVGGGSVAVGLPPTSLGPARAHFEKDLL